MKNLSNRANLIIKRRNLFFLFSVSIGITIYMINPVAYQYLLIAMVCGGIAFIVVVWYWKKPSDTKAISLIMFLIFSEDIAGEIYNIKNSGVLNKEFWFPQIIYISVFLSCLFLLMILFKKSMFKYLSTMQTTSQKLKSHCGSCT